MKIAVVSDMHGDLKSYERFEKYIEKENIEKVFNLGDLMGGLDPLPLLRKVMKEKKFISVEGNHDKEYLDLYDGITFFEKLWLKKLPLTKVVEVKGKKFLLLHSRINSNRDIPFIYNDGLLLDFLRDYEGEWDYVLFGHTHYQCLLSFCEGKTMINPGSLGMSYDNKISFCEIEIDEGLFDVRFIKLDREE